MTGFQTAEVVVYVGAVRESVMKVPLHESGGEFGQLSASGYFDVVPADAVSAFYVNSLKESDAGYDRFRAVADGPGQVTVHGTGSGQGEAPRTARISVRY